MNRPLPITADLPVLRHTLDNGLRVLLAPNPQDSVVGVAVHYDVGMRSEPAGRTGFAHLFEHLMFQGSEHLPKLEHFRYVESSGGVFNGSTHLDYTEYYLVMPRNALARALFLEADRMRAPDLNDADLRLQVDVVKEEIRVNVLNRPYGGFPWLYLPAALFETFANRHDGYGSFEDLDTATVADARPFFDRYYAPANALLCVCGAFDPDEAISLIQQYFGPIERRPAPPRPAVGEPDLTAERRVVRWDRHAPLPALAAGWRVPDPVGAWAEYLPYLALTKVMSGGGASRLERRLVRRDRLVTQQSCYLGLLSNAFDVRDPNVLVVQARQAPGVATDTVLDAVTDEFAAVAADGLRPGELRRAVIQLVTSLLTQADTVLTRTSLLAALELQHGRAELLTELPDRLQAVTEDQVRAAAATMRPDRRGLVELRPAEVLPSGEATVLPAADKAMEAAA